MAKISEKSIRKLKESVRISDVFEWLGTKVTRKGSRAMAFCPFCEDFNSRTPGCSLNDVSGLFHCFAAGTMVLTRDGARPIETLLDAPVEILNGDGCWEEVQFKSYGRQRLWEVTLSSDNRLKTIWTTQKHRWMVRGIEGDVVTEDLKPGMRLVEVRPESQPASDDYPGHEVQAVRPTGEVEEVYCCQTSTASFVLDGYILTGNCFVCGKGGDTITAVREHEECSFVEAVERLALQFNIPLEYEESSDPAGESRRKKYVEVLEAALADFHRQMSDVHWKQFVDERHLSKEAVETFELGISLLTECRGLVTRLVEQFGEEAVIGSGLCYKKDDGQIILRFRNRAIFPIRTAPGTLIGFGARDLTGKSNQKYLNSPDSELFKKRNVLYGINLARKPMAKNRRVVVCEGYMDTIALQSHGIGEAVGAMGTALTAYNLKYLANFADTIYLSLDADAAGINAAMRTADVIPENFPASVRVLSMPQVSVAGEDELKEKCGDKLYRETVSKYGGEIPYPVTVPLAKDPDEFFNERGHTLEEFEENMSSAIDLFLFCAQQQASKVIAQIDEEMDKEEPDMARLARKKQEAYRIVSDFVVGHYNKTNIYQRQGIANWITSAARLVDTFEKMEMQWRRSASIDGMNRYDSPRQAADVQPVFTSANSREEDLLISTLYHHPETREIIKQNISDLNKVFTSSVRESIFDKLNTGLSKNKDVESITASFSEEEIKELARITMGGGIEADNLSEDTINDICRTIQYKALEHKLEAAMDAPTPDLREIIKLKTQLAALR